VSAPDFINIPAIFDEVLSTIIVVAKALAPANLPTTVSLDIV